MSAIVGTNEISLALLSKVSDSNEIIRIRKSGREHFHHVFRKQICSNLLNGIEFEMKQFVIVEDGDESIHRRPTDYPEMSGENEPELRAEPSFDKSETLEEYVCRCQSIR